MSGLGNFLLPNEPTCIVACSAGSARFWLSESRFGPWTLLTEMHDEEASQHEAEFSSDRPGRSFDIVGGGRHALSPQLSGQDLQTLKFAGQVAEFLDRAIGERKATRLVILAAPAILGHIRSGLSDASLRAVVLSEPINLANLGEAGIRRYFE